MGNAQVREAKIVERYKFDITKYSVRKLHALVKGLQVFIPITNLYNTTNLSTDLLLKEKERTFTMFQEALTEHFQNVNVEMSKGVEEYTPDLVKKYKTMGFYVWIKEYAQDRKAKNISEIEKKQKIRILDKKEGEILETFCKDANVKLWSLVKYHYKYVSLKNEIMKSAAMKASKGSTCLFLTSIRKNCYLNKDIFDFLVSDLEKEHKDCLYTVHKEKCKYVEFFYDTSDYKITIAFEKS